MAVRLGEYVVYGELRNLKRYSTHGFVVLRGDADGEETVLHLELTGDCGDDLRDKCFRFMPRDDSSGGPVFRMRDVRIQPRQIGPTGVMTSQGWVRMLPCPVEEFYRRAKLGEPPPTKWVRHLYLEWYGQNGRALIEMADPIVEECIRQPENDDDEGEWAEIPNLALPPEVATGGPPPPLGISIVRADEDGDRVEHYVVEPADVEQGALNSIPLQSMLDREADAIDRAISDDYDDGDSILTEHTLLDDCFDHGESKTLASLLGDVDKLPRPETLGDGELEGQLKALLARLAMLNVAVHVCEHYTPRTCYELLLDRILTDSETYEELVGTGWVTGLMTHDYCPTCDAEAEAEYERYAQEHENEHGSDEPISHEFDDEYEDDIPF